MSYNLIPLIGVHMFLYSSIFYWDLVSLTIYINGILYHSTNNYYLRYNDIITNISFITYMLYYYRISRKYGSLAILIYVINCYLYDKKIISKNTSDLYHVLGVQLILLKALKNVLEIN